MNKYLFFTFHALMMTLCVMCSCTREDYDGDLLDDSPIIITLYQPNGLGDLSYNDATYRAVQSLAQSYGLRTVTVERGTYAECVDYLSERLTTGNDDGIKRLYVILADNHYDDFFTEHDSLIMNDCHTKVLAIGNRRTFTNIHTVDIRSYGLFYEAGLILDEMGDCRHVAIVTADTTSAYFREYTQGLRDALSDTVTTDVVHVDIDDNENITDLMYTVSYGFDGQYDVVIPMCGATGLLRYNREHEWSFSTIGTGADMSLYSSCVPFSCVKDIYGILSVSVGEWLSGQMSSHHAYGLESGMVRIVASPTHKELIDSMISNNHQTAIDKENEKYN